MNERMGAEPWLARTRAEYARMLEARGRSRRRGAGPRAGGCGGRRGADLPPLCRFLTATARSLGASDRTGRSTAKESS